MITLYRKVMREVGFCYTMYICVHIENFGLLSSLEFVVHHHKEALFEQIMHRPYLLNCCLQCFFSQQNHKTVLCFCSTHDQATNPYFSLLDYQFMLLFFFADTPFMEIILFCLIFHSTLCQVHNLRQQLCFLYAVIVNLCAHSCVGVYALCLGAL